MKKIILRFFGFTAILFIVDSIITGFEFDKTSSQLSLALILSLFSTLLKPVIQFLTIPFNFFTFGLFNFILSCAALYIFDLLIGGFEITAGFISSLNSENIQVSEIKLSSVAVIIISSIFISILNNIVDWTQKD